MTDDKKKGGKGYGNLRPELRQKYFKHLNERSKVAGPHDEGKRKKPEPSLTQILEEYFEEETKLPDAVGTIEIDGEELEVEFFWDGEEDHEEDDSDD